jgi:hypothetical protein
MPGAGVFTRRLCGRSGSTVEPLCGLAVHRSLETLELPMDIVFIAVGAGMFALFAVYAVLLRRV